MMPNLSSVPQAHETLLVDLGVRSYDILIGSNLLAQADAHIIKAVGKRRCLIVTDGNVAPHYAAKLHAILEKAGLTQNPPFVIPAGEKSKSFSFLSNLLRDVLMVGIDRNSVLVALGGGMIGDLTGFAAAIALRGIDFIQIPTTLLSQVDSSVGGKTGINAAAGKNLVGAFHQPRLVLADIATLKTLPLRELRAGYAEIIKYGLISNPEFFAWLEKNGAHVLGGRDDEQVHAIKTSCQMKADIVGRDEHERGERALLNLGHTFAHAFESATQYDGSLLHGEAVSIGINMAFKLSVRLGLCPAEAAQRVEAHLKALNMPYNIGGRGWHAEQLIAAMYKDKKAQDNALTFILAHDIGKAFVAKDVQPADVKAVLGF